MSARRRTEPRLWRGLAGRGALLVVALLALPLGDVARAQASVSATSAVDRRSITIGDPILLTVTVEADLGYQVSPPAVVRTIGDLEVLKALPAQESRQLRGGTRVAFRYRITSFQLGDHAVPPFAVEYVGPGGVRGAARTAEIEISVKSVLRAGEDASDIKPLKPQLELPGGLQSRLLSLAEASAATLVLALPVMLVYRAARRRRRRRLPREPEHTPARRTMAELRRIADLRLPEKDRYPEHYELLAGALRRYVLEQFGLPAPQRTPRELRAEMERAGVDRRQATTIYEILRESERVRFQRQMPYPRHAQEALRGAAEVLGKVAAAEEYATELAREA